MKLAKKIFGLFILLGTLILCGSIHAAEKKCLDAREFISEATEDQTSEINTFLMTCKALNMDAFFNKGVYKFNGTVVLVDGVSLFGEEGTIFRGTDATYQSYIRDTKEKVTNITIEHIIFDNVTIYFQNNNSTNITIEHNIFANAKKVDLSVSSGLKPSNNQNGGEATGYYIAKNHKTITIKSNLFFRDENSWGRGISIYYTENALIEDNYFGILEDIDNSIVSLETKALKNEAIASGILSTTSNQGYFMTAINVINSDVNAKIIGNHFSLNTDIFEQGYEDRSQSTDGYNRDHIIYAKMFNGLEVVGNYFKGMNKNQDGGIKFRNGENLLIHKNILEDTLILLYVQEATNNLWFRNVYIKENFFINRFYTTDSFTSSITNAKKSFSIDYLILLMNYKEEASITNITIESNKMISPKYANEEVRIDNRSFAMPTNVTIRNNVNSCVNQAMRIRIINTDGQANWYDSNTAGQNFSNVLDGTVAFTMDVSAYENISVEALCNLNEVAFELQDRKIVTNAVSVYVDGILYDNQELAYGEHFIFLTAPTVAPLVVEGTTRMLQTNLFTARKIAVEKAYKITYEANQQGTLVEEEWSSRLPNELPILSKEGYIFEGWYKDEGLSQKAIPGVVIEQDTVLYAKWTRLYNVTYNTLGHGISPAGITNVLFLPASLPELKEEGYIFEGWYLDAELTSKAIENASISEDLILYAKWTKIPTYMITFDSQGGSLVDSIALLKGSRVTELKEPTKEGYIFMGWYLDENFTKLWNKENSIEQDITLYAKWNKPPQHFKVTFQYAGGGVFTILTAEEDKLLSRPEDATISGYQLDGWYLDEDCTVSFDFEKDYITKDTILYGKWVSIMVGYTITYQVNGHGIAPTKINEANKLPNPLPVLTETGYEFSGWYLDKDLKTPAAAGTTIQADTTLYAKWTKKMVYYTVTFSLEDTVLDSISVVEGGKAIKPEEPQKEGYTFYGWYEDETYTTQWDFEQDAVLGPVMLYGIFVKNEPVSSGNEASALLYILIPSICILVCGGFAGIVIFKKRKNKSL